MEVAMSRRSTPERLHEARRAANLQRLIGERELPDRSETLVAAWMEKADAEGLVRDGRYWDRGWDWIAPQRNSSASRASCHS
jgi:hypothetical protein